MSTGNHHTSGGEISESAPGEISEKLSLPSLQSKMKIDPEGYTTELGLIYSRFNCALEMFQQQAALRFTSSVCADPTIAKELGERTMFLSQVAPFYSKELARFPGQLVDFLKSSARSLPFGLRGNVTQALILLVNRKMVDIKNSLALFMELQTVGDRNLRILAFSHVVNSIKRMNKKHKNEAKNRTLQNILFTMMQQEDEPLAKRALITLCELHRRKVWFDDRTANAICMACFHSSSRIMNAALSFVLDFEKMQDDHNSDSKDMSSDDDANPRHAQVAINKESIFKATKTGTSVVSKKKKKAKLERVVRSMESQQRLESEKTGSNYYSPLNHLKDAQGFAEKLFSRLNTCNERFEVKMMLMRVIARTIGLHNLILLNFYPFLQKYCQPHQRDVTSLLSAAVQACHDMVPPDAVEPLFRQIVNQFVHDHSHPEAISVGLNVIREICLRIPLLMTEDLLQDLVLYKKQHEKAVSAAARSLMVLFREICPSLLVKKDRGRPIDPEAKPKACGENHVDNAVPGIELLDEGADTDERDEDAKDDGDDSQPDDHELFGSDDEEDRIDNDDLRAGLDDSDSDDNVDEIGSGKDEGEEEDNDGVEEEDEEESSDSQDLDEVEVNKSKSKKRKRSDFNGDGFVSQEDFKRIRELQAKIAATQHGFKLPSSDQLSMKPMDPSKLEAHIRHKMSKEERLEMVKAGREDRGKYQARSSIRKKKTGGLSNQQKNHKKKMPPAAKRLTIVRNRANKRKKSDRSGKQFRGKKAWK